MGLRLVAQLTSTLLEGAVENVLAYRPCRAEHNGFQRPELADMLRIVHAAPPHSCKYRWLCGSCLSTGGKEDT